MERDGEAAEEEEEEIEPLLEPLPREMILDLGFLPVESFIPRALSSLSETSLVFALPTAYGHHALTPKKIFLLHTTTYLAMGQASENSRYESTLACRELV